MTMSLPFQNTWVMFQSEFPMFNGEKVFVVKHFLINTVAEGKITETLLAVPISLGFSWNKIVNSSYTTKSRNYFCDDKILMLQFDSYVIDLTNFNYITV